MGSIIFNVYQTLEDVNGTGFIGIFQASSDAVPFFPALILGALFIILAFVSFTSSQRRNGRGDLPSSFSVAGLVCVVVSILMSMIPNFINIRDIVITIIIEIVFVFWLMLSKE